MVNYTGRLILNVKLNLYYWLWCIIHFLHVTRLDLLTFKGFRVFVKDIDLWFSFLILYSLYHVFYQIYAGFIKWVGTTFLSLFSGRVCINWQYFFFFKYMVAFTNKTLCPWWFLLRKNFPFKFNFFNRYKTNKLFYFILCQFW